MEHDPQWSLKTARDLLAHDSDRTSTGHHPRVAFTPDGEHGIRVVGDPNGKLYRLLDTHQYKKYRCYCPEFFRERDPNGDYPSCAICTVATQRGDWRLRREALVLVYGALYRTSHTSPYWQPGKTYLMIAPAALCIGLTQFVAQGSAQQ